MKTALKVEWVFVRASFYLVWHAIYVHIEEGF